MRLRCPRYLFAALCLVTLSRAAPFDDRVETLFRPPQGEMMALSPDGQRIAYTVQEGQRLAIAIMNVEPPGAKRTIKIDPEPEVAATEERPTVRLRYLRWATATRLVYAPEVRVVPLPPVLDRNGRAVPNPDGPAVFAPVFVTDADGRQRGTLIDAAHFQETPAEARKTLADLLRTTKELVATRNEPVRWRMPHLDVLGFLPRDREQLVVRTHGAYSIPSQHLVDIRTGNVREFGSEWPAAPGAPHLFDEYRLKIVGERREAVHPSTAWHDDELSRVQRELEARFPRRIVEIIDWSETRARVLFRVTGGSDPGRVFVWQRPEEVVLEVLLRAPWLPAAKVHETRFLEFPAPDGASLSGYLTLPAKPRVTPPPLLVVFAAGFPGRAHAAFDPEAQVFADLGFAVLRLNHRSVSGIRREDLERLRNAMDRVSVDDARAAVEWVAAHQPERAFDRQRVGTLGRGFGGYLAVRALQLHPATFSCGIAIDAPMELRSWVPASERRAAAGAAKPAPMIPAALLDHTAAGFDRFSVLANAEALERPALLLVEPGRDPAIDASMGALRSRLQGLGRAVDYVELDPGFSAARAESRAVVYRKIEDFLNQHLQRFAVKIGPMEEVK